MWFCAVIVSKFTSSSVVFLSTDCLDCWQFAAFCSFFALPSRCSVAVRGPLQVPETHADLLDCAAENTRGTSMSCCSCMFWEFFVFSFFCNNSLLCILRWHLPAVLSLSPTVTSSLRLPSTVTVSVFCVLVC